MQCLLAWFFSHILSDINCEICVLGIISSILWFAFAFYFFSFNNDHNALVLLGPMLSCFFPMGNVFVCFLFQTISYDMSFPRSLKCDFSS